MNQLKDKVIAITGAASGIGSATAKECAARGASLALSDINTEPLDEVVKELKSQYPELDVTSSKVDVASSSSVDDWIAGVVKHFGRIDGACNIAGVETKPGIETKQNLVDISDEKWQFVIGINLTGVFHCVRAELRAMKRGASIVNAASTAGIRGGATLAAYTASKHGVVGLTKSVAKEVGADGIRVNAVCPGPIDTPLLRRLASDNQTYWKTLEQATAMKVMGKVEDVAKTFCYLLSDDAAWMTGTTTTIDGGMTA